MYQHVVILGIDGAGRFFTEAETPQLDRIFKNGATTSNALTAIPTISAECWGSMLLGVTPEAHGLTNAIVSRQPYDVQSQYPSVFRVAREAMPAAALASFCHWNPINKGIIEDNLDVHKASVSNDAQVCGMILDYLDQHAPTLLFVQFDEVDDAGHKFGYGTPAYLEKITEIDGLVGKIYDKYAEQGLAANTLFIVSADHGGNRRHGHGGKSRNEKRIFIGCAGKTVRPGKLKKMRVRDIAAITAAALGLHAPNIWTARVPKTLFDESV